MRSKQTKKTKITVIYFQLLLRSFGNNVDSTNYNYKPQTPENYLHRIANFVTLVRHWKDPHTLIVVRLL